MKKFLFFSSCLFAFLISTLGAFAQTFGTVPVPPSPDPPAPSSVPSGLTQPAPPPPTLPNIVTAAFNKQLKGEISVPASWGTAASMKTNFAKHLEDMLDVYAYTLQNGQYTQPKMVTNCILTIDEVRDNGLDTFILEYTITSSNLPFAKPIKVSFINNFCYHSCTSAGGYFQIFDRVEPNEYAILKSNDTIYEDYDFKGKEMYKPAY